MDRSRLIQNPNHPPPRPSLSSFPYPHAIAQPLADPFPRRSDPFIMSTSSDKRDAQYGHPPYTGNGASRIETLQPAPPPPPSPYHSRRGSLSGTYSGGPLEPPPPPPPPLPGAISRQMPPPAASPKQDTPSAYSHAHSRGSLPNPPPYNSGRDAAPSYSGHRPSSSMSISSIMGSDTGAAPRPPLWAQYSSRNPQAAPGQYPPPHSPQYERRPGYHGEVSIEGRPRTPERRAESQFAGPYARPGAVISPIGHSIPQGTTPDQSNPGYPRLFQPPLHSSPPGPMVPPRPFSQPAGFDAGVRGQGYRGGYDQMPGGLNSSQGPPEDRVNPIQNIQNGIFEKTLRDRSMSDLDGRKGPLLAQSLLRPLHDQGFNHNGGTARAEQSPFLRRQEYQTGPTKLESMYGSHYNNPTDLLRRPGSPLGTQSVPPPGQQQRAGPHFVSSFLQAEQAVVSKPSVDQQEQSSSGFPPADIGQSGHLASIPTVIDGQLRRSLEETHAQQRSLLQISNEHVRRQASPLPQAVQGAQSQPVGSGRDPGIKSEFGRMFSGLGSGVGSTPQPVPSSGYGPPTPAPRSPGIDDAEAERSGQKVSEGARGASSATRGGRKGKRTLDEEANPGSESGDGRSTPVGSGRGSKRNRYTLPGHHHHHHPVAHHHHHHHPKPTDEVVPPIGARRSSSTPFNTFKFPATNQGTNSVPAAIPHHHHHHHPPHHHHHPPKSGATNQAPNVRLPTTTILTKPLISSVAHLSRMHLGSQLYAPTVHLPSTASSTVDSPYTYTSTPNPLPRFEGRENCTFTVRVPRYYLTQRAREDICNARLIWGTDVYTDDSDPVAAAIHSGWIRGAWSPEVDVEMLNLSTPVPASSSFPDDEVMAKQQRSTEDATATTTTAISPAPPKRLTEPPSTPVQPPRNMDLHLTLLVLPTLEKYASSVWYGVKSRSWGGNHDGMSFKIERVEWVDEGAEARNEERGAEARKRRVADVARVLAAAAAAAARKGGNGTVNGVSSASRDGGKLGRRRGAGNAVMGLPMARVAQAAA